MAILAVWILIAFCGLCYQLILTGFTMQDRRWFERLGFSEDAQDTATGDVETESRLCVFHGGNFLIGVLSYVSNPVGPRPISPISLTISLILITLPLMFIESSIRRQRRRDRIEHRGREQAIASAGGTSS